MAVRALDNIPLPSILEHGYQKLKEDGGEEIDNIAISWDTGLVMPIGASAPLQSCGCKKGCVKNCQCRKLNRPCTSNCNCRNCENKPKDPSVVEEAEQEEEEDEEEEADSDDDEEQEDEEQADSAQLSELEDDD